MINKNLLIFVFPLVVSCAIMPDKSKQETPGENLTSNVLQNSNPANANPIKVLQTIVLSGATQKEFFIRRDGFSFQNYTNQNKPRNLTPATFERLCGQNACARGTGDACVPAGALRPFLDYANKSMSGGHCEGMSVLAQAIFEEIAPLQTFDSNAQTTFNLRFDNPNVQSEIAYWFATQMTYPAGYSELKLTPREVLEKLKNSREHYSFGIFKPDGRDGHAVTPIKLLRTSPAEWYVQIYDSNYPGNQNRFIKINTASNTWSYASYVGNAQTKSLTLRPFVKRLEQQTCPTLDKNSQWRIWLNGGGTLKAPSSAQAIWRTSEASFEQKSLDPIYIIEPTEDVQLRMVGDDVSMKEPTSLVVFKQNQAFALEGIKLKSKEIDLVKLTKEQDSISYSTDDSEKIVARVAQTYAGADYELKIHPSPKAKGFDIELKNKIDEVNGKHELAIRILNNDGSAGTFTVEMTRIGDVVDDNFTHLIKDVPIKPKETVTLEYGKWIKDRQPLSILRDVDSDGEVEQKQSLADEE